VSPANGARPGAPASDPAGETDAAKAPRLILLDIEGTTTPITFVTETLFPYARAHMRPFLDRHGRSAETASLLSLMDRDSKAPELKALQGRIWEEGYREGTLAGDVFDDVPRAFARWHDAGTPIGLYSSGSVLAQQWLFRTVAAGDLTRYIRWYFDTAVGAKREPASYARIAEAVETPPSAITFVSDTTAELDAASIAGMRTVLSLRPGNAPQPPSDHRTITSFDEL
jgi:enolase-phosphatase E1